MRGACRRRESVACPQLHRDPVRDDADEPGDLLGRHVVAEVTACLLCSHVLDERGRELLGLRAV